MEHNDGKFEHSEPASRCPAGTSLEEIERRECIFRSEQLRAIDEILRHERGFDNKLAEMERRETEMHCKWIIDHWTEDEDPAELHRILLNLGYFSSGNRISADCGGS